MTDVVRGGVSRAELLRAQLAIGTEQTAAIARQPERVERLPDLSGDRLKKWREKLLSFPKQGR